MAFASAPFLSLFLPLVLVGWYALPGKLRVPFLLAASWVFYAWWRVDFLALIVGLSVVTWLVGRFIASTRTRGGPPGRPRALLAAGIILNVGCLAFFK